MGHRFSSRMWYALLPSLTARHRVIWFDNRGTGESDAPHRTTMNDLASDAFAVMDAAGVDSAHIFGVSMGGVIVEEMTMTKPQRVRSMIVGCSGVLSEEIPRSKKSRRFMYYLPFFVYAALGKKALYGTASPADAVARDLEMLKKDKFDPRGVIAQSEALNGYRTTHEAVAKITTPSLVMHGTEDPVVPFALGEDLVKTLPNARMVAFEGAGHNYFIADIDRASKEVLAFFESVDQG